MEHSAKLAAKVKLTKRSVDALDPEDKPWIAWDDKLTGFGVLVHPSEAKSFVVNYRAGNGGRKAPNKRVVAGRVGRVTPDQARRQLTHHGGKDGWLTVIFEHPDGGHGAGHGLRRHCGGRVEGADQADVVDVGALPFVPSVGVARLLTHP